MSFSVLTYSLISCFLPMEYAVPFVWNSNQSIQSDELAGKATSLGFIPVSNHAINLTANQRGLRIAESLWKVKLSF